MSYGVTLDPSFTPDQFDAVIAGVEEWKTHVPELHFTYSVSTCDSPTECQICLHPAHDPPDPARDVIGTTYPSDNDSASVVIYVDRIVATGWDVAELTQQTTAHEIGHAVGLVHTGRGTLMAADVPDQAQQVTDADIAQFWAVRGR